MAFDPELRWGNMVLFTSHMEGREETNSASKQLFKTSVGSTLCFWRPHPHGMSNVKCTHIFQFIQCNFVCSALDRIDDSILKLFAYKLTAFI